MISMVSAQAAGTEGRADAVSETQATIDQLRQHILPDLAAELSALHMESAEGIASVGAGDTVIQMRRELVRMDDDLAAITRALKSDELQLSDVLDIVDRFSSGAVRFGSAMEALVGSDSRFEPLRLEDDRARKRLLVLATRYRHFAATVSALLRLLPDAIEARLHQR